MSRVRRMVSGQNIRWSVAKEILQQIALFDRQESTLSSPFYVTRMVCNAWDNLPKTSAADPQKGGVNLGSHPSQMGDKNSSETAGNSYTILIDLWSISTTISLHRTRVSETDVLNSQVSDYGHRKDGATHQRSNAVRVSFSKGDVKQTNSILRTPSGIRKMDATSLYSNAALIPLG